VPYGRAEMCQRPDAIALIAGDDMWTYDHLATDVARLSSGLRRAGILPGDRIAMVFSSQVTSTTIFPRAVPLTSAS
jgi:non-ribosomal peptide synthetase component E (peptide arylation enzyme)